MKLIRTSALLMALVALATASVGQESPPPAAPAATPAPPPAAAKPPAAAPAPARAEAPPAGPKSASRDEEFIPTQEVQADEEVTFPVDI